MKRVCENDKNRARFEVTHLKLIPSKTKQTQSLPLIILYSVAYIVLWTLGNVLYFTLPHPFPRE